MKLLSILFILSLSTLLSAKPGPGNILKRIVRSGQSIEESEPRKTENTKDEVDVDHARAESSQDRQQKRVKRNTEEGYMKETVEHYVKTFSDSQWSNMLFHCIGDHEDFLEGLARFAKNQVAEHGGVALFRSIHTNAEKCLTILHTADARIREEDTSPILGYIERMVKTADDWKLLLARVVTYKQIYILGIIMEDSTTRDQIRKHGGAALFMAEELKNESARILLSLAGVKPTSGLNYVQPTSSALEISDSIRTNILPTISQDSQLQELFVRWARQNTCFGRETLEAFVKNGLSDLRTFGGRALFYAMMHDSHESQSILVNAGVRILPSDNDHMFEYIESCFEDDSSSWQGLLKNLVLLEQMGFLQTVTNRWKAQVIAHGSIALFTAIKKDDNEAKSILVNAGVTITSKDKETLLGDMRPMLPAKWDALFSNLANHGQTYLLEIIAEEKNDHLRVCCKSALSDAEELDDPTAFIIYKIAGVGPRIDPAQFVEYLKGKISEGKANWQDILRYIVKFGSHGLLEYIAEAVPLKLLAHGGVAFFHAIAENRCEAEEILWKAGVQIKSDDIEPVIGYI